MPDNRGDVKPSGCRDWREVSRFLKQYQMPYGVAEVERHVYQARQGGPTHCPVDERAGLFLSATPALARLVAAKYAEFGSARVQHDLEVNHGRQLSRGFIDDLAEAVAILARGVAEKRPFDLPDLDHPVSDLFLSLTSTPVGSQNEVPRQAGIASFGLYDEAGRRQHAIYIAELFEAGLSEPIRSPFLQRVEEELRVIRDALPRVRISGITAGESWAVEFLGRWEFRQVLDPRWILDRLEAVIALEPEDRRREHRLGAARLRRVFEERGDFVNRLHNTIRNWQGAATPGAEEGRWRGILGDLDRHRDARRLDYSSPLDEPRLYRLGLLAELVEALIGDRFRQARLRAELRSADPILTLRELTRTPGRWERFWDGLTSGRLGRMIAPGRD